MEYGLHIQPFTFVCAGNLRADCWTSESQTVQFSAGFDFNYFHPHIR